VDTINQNISLMRDKHMNWISAESTEPNKDARYLITDGFNISFGYYSFDGEEYRWYPDDCGNVDCEGVTHFAELMLPVNEVSRK
jgi:hypothetical protein